MVFTNSLRQEGSEKNRQKSFDAVCIRCPENVHTCGSPGVYVFCVTRCTSAKRPPFMFARQSFMQFLATVFIFVICVNLDYIVKHADLVVREYSIDRARQK
jgi:hypothetical protein